MKTLTEQMPEFVGCEFSGIFAFNQAIMQFFPEENDDSFKVIAYATTNIRCIIKKQADNTPFPPLMRVTDIGYWGAVKVEVFRPAATGPVFIGSFSMDVHNGRPVFKEHICFYVNLTLLQLEVARPSIQRIRKTFTPSEAEAFEAICKMDTSGDFQKSPLYYAVQRDAQMFRVIVMEMLEDKVGKLFRPYGREPVFQGMRTIAHFSKTLPPDYEVVNRTVTAA